MTNKGKQTTAKTHSSDSDLELKTEAALEMVTQDTLETPEELVETKVVPEKLALAPEAQAADFKETVVSINRVTKVVSGGKRLAFSAVVVVGNGNGLVGVGKGKARDVQSAIAKASFQGKKHLVSVPRKETTIPFAVVGHFGAGEVLLRPASAGTGVIAGGIVRAILEASGIRDILTKNLGSSNVYSVLYATLDAFRSLRTKEDVAKKRGKKEAEI